MKTHEPVPNQMLKTARLEKCWTLAMTAEKANVSLEAYSRWELGKQEPRLSSLLLLSEAFGKSPEDLGFGHLTKQSHPQEVIKAHTEATQGPSTAVLPSQQVMILAPEQVASFQQLLGLGDDMKAFDQTKRNALAKSSRSTDALFFKHPTVLVALL